MTNAINQEENTNGKIKDKSDLNAESNKLNYEKIDLGKDPDTYLFNGHWENPTKANIFTEGTLSQNELYFSIKVINNLKRGKLLTTHLEYG